MSKPATRNTQVLTVNRNAAAALASQNTELAVDKAGSTNSQVPSKAHSQVTTPDGSPPISPAPTPGLEAQQAFPNNEDVRAIRPGGLGVLATSSQTKFSSKSKPAPASRQPSKGGGIQTVLDEQGSWSMLADQSATLPVDAKENKDKQESGSVLGFLRGRKGRDRSPKPKEAGVLGKVGARQFIS